MTKERKTRNVRGATSEEENVCSKKQFLNNCMQCVFIWIVFRKDL